MSAPRPIPRLSRRQASRVGRARRPSRRLALSAAAGLALLAGAALGQDLPQRARAGGEAEPLGSASLPSYQVSGVRDAAGFATVVVCTNFSGAPMDMTLVVRDFDGTVDCNLTLAGVAAQESATFATRDTPLYTEDRICAAPPGTDGGWAVLSAAGRLHALVCTAQTIATGPNGVVSMNRLPLYTSAGALLRDRLFADGFESGDASRWSSVQSLTGDELTDLPDASPTSPAWTGCRLPLRERSRQIDGRAV